MIDYFDFTYNAGSLITARERGQTSAEFKTWYTYDDAYRLTEENYKTTGGTSKSKRTYGYDVWGNRTSMTQWNDASVNKTTAYTYGNRNQITDDDGYYDHGMHDTGAHEYTFDAKGNMTQRSWTESAVDYDTNYTWNQDNRLTDVSNMQDDGEEETGIDVAFRYNSVGERVLKSGPHTHLAASSVPRTRYFFHGLTEEIKKVNVLGVYSDAAFDFTEREDGASASNWSAEAGAVSADDDAARRSSVIRCVYDDSGQSSYTAGDNGANGRGILVVELAHELPRLRTVPGYQGPVIWHSPHPLRFCA